MGARRSILVRLLAGAVLIALCSIAATAWLAARSTTVAIQEQQGQALADDAKIYNTLLEYAATHRNWSGVERLVAQLGQETERQIGLSTRDRKPIAGRPVPPDRKPSAVVYPLQVDPNLAGGDQIDPRV